MSFSYEDWEEAFVKQIQSEMENDPDWDADWFADDSINKIQASNTQNELGNVEDECDLYFRAHAYLHRRQDVTQALGKRWQELQKQEALNAR